MRKIIDSTQARWLLPVPVNPSRMTSVALATNCVVPSWFTNSLESGLFS